MTTIVMRLSRRELYESSGEFQRTVSISELGLDDLSLLKDNLPVTMKIKRSGSTLDVRGEVTADLKETCDRCLEIYDKTIKGSFRILVTEDPSMLNETSNSDIMFFSSDQNEIDISPALRDSIVLERPMKEICSKECKGLCAGCGVNLNTSNCKCKKEEMDERWAPLKEINLSDMEN